jgi:hypothetical protein
MDISVIFALRPNRVIAVAVEGSGAETSVAIVDLSAHIAERFLPLAATSQSALQ